MPPRSPAKPQRGLRHLALKTRSLAATKQFYVDGLGLAVAFTHKGMLFLETPGGEDLINFMLTRRQFDAEAGGFDHFGLRVPAGEWVSVMGRLKRQGIPPIAAPWCSRAAARRRPARLRRSPPPAPDT